MHLEFFINEWVLIYGGLILTLVIVFMETAFPIGVIIPGGEALLLITGIIAGTKWVDVNILFVIIPVTLIAFIGDLTGYSIGNKIGMTLLKQKDGWFLKKKFLLRTEKFNRKFKVLSFVLAHFIPVIRTFNPIWNGAKETAFPTYFLFSGIGCLIYVNTLIVIGFVIGNYFPNLKMNLEYIIAAVLFFIFFTPVISIVRNALHKEPKEKTFADE